MISAKNVRVEFDLIRVISIQENFFRSIISSISLGKISVRLVRLTFARSTHLLTANNWLGPPLLFLLLLPLALNIIGALRDCTGFRQNVSPSISNLPKILMDPSQSLV